MTRASRLTWRNRVVSLTCVGIYLGFAHAFVHDPLLREKINYGVVITLGYGHLVGAAFFSRHRMAEKLAGPTRFLTVHLGHLGLSFQRRPTSIQHGVSSLCLIAFMSLLYLSYIALLNHVPEAWLPMLAISIWHSIENNQCLKETYQAQIRLPALTNKTQDHLISLGASSCLMAWSLTLIQPDWVTASLALRVLGLLSGAILMTGDKRTLVEKWLGVLVIGASSLPPDWLFGTMSIHFSDLFTASILYHLVSWAVLSIEKSFRPGTPMGTRRDMLFIHLLPLAILISTYAWPQPWGSSLRSDFLAPASYLFWSVIHVAQTAWLRGPPKRTPPHSPR